MKADQIHRHIGKTEVAQASHDNEPDKHQVLIKHLDGLGYKNVGNGSFASVFLSPDGKKAIKIQHIHDKFVLKYLKKAMETKNPYMPRIYDMKDVGSGWGKRYQIIVMEPLVKANVNAVKRLFKQPEVMTYLSVKGLDWAVPEIAGIPDPDDYVERFIEDKAKARTLASTLPRKDPNFVQWLSILNSMWKSGVTIDNRIPNIMTRPKDGHIVFIDPVVDF